jgi:CheY-like chemotaxis protein
VQATQHSLDSSEGTSCQREQFLATNSPIHVLCVDDDANSLMARRLLLVIAGYDVLTATSGDAALQILRRRSFDLVIADHFLPNFTGADLTRAIKLMNPAIRVVLLTWKGEAPPGADQADLLLMKAMPPAEFLAEIAALMNRASSAVPD